LGTFGFLVVVARSGAPAVLGGVLALAAVALLFEVPANALQAAMGARAKEGASLPGLRGSLVTTSALGALACAALLALSPLVKGFLHLGSASGALLLGPYALVTGLGVAPKGLLTARGRLGHLAAGLLVGLGARLGVGYALVSSGAGVGGAMGAMVLGETLTVAIVLGAAWLAEGTSRPAGGPYAVAVPLGRPGPPAQPGPRRPEHRFRRSSGRSPVQALSVEPGALRWGEARVPAIAFTGYWALSAVDVVLARHWLVVQASGWYAGAATAAQLALIAPGAAATLAFPKLASADLTGPVSPEARPWQRLMFALASAVVALTGLLTALVVSLWSGPLVEGLFGSPYGPAGTVVGLLSVAAAVLSLVSILVHYHLARGSRWAACAGWLGTLAAVAGVVAWHASMRQVALVMVGSSAFVCALMLLVALGKRELSPVSLVERANLALLDADLDLTVVVPYYNPGSLLVPTVERVLDVLDRSGASYEVIAVSDGSTDGSDGQLDELSRRSPRLENLVLAHNQGKGAALRVGLAKGRGRYLGFIDADGDLDPLLLESFQTMVRLYSPDIILGSKRHPLSEVEYPLLRRIYSWGYQQVVRLGFRLNIRDTQTGIKLVRRDVLAAVLPRMVEKRFAFDLELFVIARRLGYKRFLEAPIRLRHQFTSTVSWRAVYRALLDTMAIWYRLRVLHFYDGDQEPATPIGELLRIDPIVLHGGAGAGAGSPNAPGRPRVAGGEAPRPSALSS
jgi:glycosyltransferase involved in cell wall biosynthesis/O-antigen/teichoic acid export membrane protein